MHGYAGASLIGQYVSFRHPEDDMVEWGRVVDEHDDGTVTVEYRPDPATDATRGLEEVRVPADSVEVDSPW